ncbi:cation/H(+) antiporter 15-like [Magnolia sinica]|uniref:cation/H(+) antiporter 15-like n=1 Tax=Magnolia sinica TaxID=86752 RepID=UPI00265AD11C|nr:cation/H(+) antiporter 15-like [Magnolia sinica]
MEADAMDNPSAIFDDKESLMGPMACRPAAVSGILSHGIWLGQNPLHFGLPLLLFQISLISIITWTMHYLLKPFRQPRIISSIMGGIILGPSILGRSKSFRKMFFPRESQMLVETAGLLGVTFFLFIVGVKMDPTIIKKSGKQSVLLAISNVFFPAILLSFLTLTFNEHIIPAGLSINHVMKLSIMTSMTSFPVIAVALTELGMLNSDVGHLLMSSVIIGEIFAVSFVSATLAANIAAENQMYAIGMVLSMIVLIVFIICVFRPISLWIIKQTPENQPVAKTHIFIIIIGILVTAFIGETIGQHSLFGPFILGLVIPVGPPLGSAMVERIESVALEILMPLYFVSTGLKVNVYAIHDWKAMLFLEGIVIIGCLAKIAASTLLSVYINIPKQDALVFGLFMCSKGIMEVVILNIWKNDKSIDNQEYISMIVSILMVTSICTPLVTAIYKPTMRYIAYSWRTVQHSVEGNLGPCLLTCVHDEDNVPPIINLLQMSNISRFNPLAVHVLHLVNMVGRASPLLMPYKPTKYPTGTNRIMNAFQQYERNYRGHVWLQPFIAIAPHETMHNDICSLAHTKHVSLVIMPFHKQPAVDGRMMLGGSGQSIKIINRNVLEEAPCSVGILVNCRALGGIRQPRQHWFHLAVLFLGGRDDRETLAYAAWMASNPSVSIYVTRCVPLDWKLYDSIEKKLDDEMVAKFKMWVMGNNRVSYREEEVADGVGTVAVIRSMGDMYDLFMVGWGLETETVLTRGLRDWNDDCELGIVGDFLASTDYSGAAAVLVLRQQARVGSIDGAQPMSPMAHVSITTSNKIHDPPDMPEDLYQIFSKYARAEDYYTPWDEKLQRHRGYGSIRFFYLADAYAAIGVLNGMKVDGWPLTVEIGNP